MCNPWFGCFEPCPFKPSAGPSLSQHLLRKEPTFAVNIACMVEYTFEFAISIEQIGWTQKHSIGVLTNSRYFILLNLHVREREHKVTKNVAKVAKKWRNNNWKGGIGERTTKTHKYHVGCRRRERTSFVTPMWRDRDERRPKRSRKGRWEEEENRKEKEKKTRHVSNYDELLGAMHWEGSDETAGESVFASSLGRIQSGIRGLRWGRRASEKPGFAVPCSWSHQWDPRTGWSRQPPGTCSRWCRCGWFPNRWRCTHPLLSRCVAGRWSTRNLSHWESSFWREKPCEHVFLWASCRTEPSSPACRLGSTWGTLSWNWRASSHDDGDGGSSAAASDPLSLR